MTVRRYAYSLHVDFSFRQLVAAQEIDFNRDVRPILSNNCFMSRSDAAARQADLRLDTAEGISEQRDPPLLIKGDATTGEFYTGLQPPMLIEDASIRFEWVLTLNKSTF